MELEWKPGLHEEESRMLFRHAWHWQRPLWLDDLVRRMGLSICKGKSNKFIDCPKQPVKIQTLKCQTQVAGFFPSHL